MFNFVCKSRPAIVGLILGATIGLMIGLGYGITCIWLCSGIRKCPDNWVPFAIVTAIIFMVITPIGVIVAVISARLYKIFDTALYTGDNERSD